MGILLPAKRRRDAAATNSSAAVAIAVLSELTGLLLLKENKKCNFFSLEKIFLVFPFVALARFQWSVHCVAFTRMCRHPTDQKIYAISYITKKKIMHFLFYLSKKGPWYFTQTVGPPVRKLFKKFPSSSSLEVWASQWAIGLHDWASFQKKNVANWKAWRPLTPFQDSEINWIIMKRWSME